MYDCDPVFEKPLKLQTVLEAMEMAGSENQTFYNTDTGELRYSFGKFSFPENEYDDMEGDEWVSLPDSYDIRDLHWMRAFARQQPPPVGDKLLDAAYARHPYRRFKDVAHTLDVAHEWYAYRDERLREVALEWFERHGMTPPDVPPEEADPQFKVIQKELRIIEERAGVRILFAVEAGSRAWGFASPESDYDVRFVYARPREEYLRLDGMRDVLEWEADDGLDVVGWDVQKFLRLAHEGNPSVFEWLASPVVYLDTPDRERIERVVCRRFSPKASAFANLRMAQANRGEHLGDDLASPKGYLRVIRPLLAARWVLDKQTAPPALLAELAESQLEPDLKPLVDELVGEMTAGRGRERRPRIGKLDRWIDDALETLEATTRDLPSDPNPDWDDLNKLFRNLIW